MEDVVGYIPPPMGPINEQTTLRVKSKVTKPTRKPNSLVPQQAQCTYTRKRKGRAVTSLEAAPALEYFET